MKSCPSCQQVYPDGGPDYCTNDGTPLMRSSSEYNPGAPPGGQWQQPPTGWQPPSPPPGYGYQPTGQYQPGGQYPPYGYAPSSGQGEGLSKAALITGIAATCTFLLAVLLAVMAINSRSRDMLPVVGIFGLLALLAGLTAVILGIVALSMVSKNPNPGTSKVKAIIGLCLGVLPIVLWLIGLANAGRSRF